MANSAAAPALLVLAGGLVITQTLFGQALERLGIKAALTGGGGSSGGGLSGTLVGPIPGVTPGPVPATPGTPAAAAQASGQQGFSHYLPGSNG